MIKNGGEKACDCVCSITDVDNENRWDKMLHGSGGNSVSLCGVRDGDRMCENFEEISRL